MANQLLLLKDVEDLGRSGDLVKVKPGYARNYLLPKGFAVIADKHTLRMREKLQKEREKQAIRDRKESEEIATRLSGLTFTINVKVAPDGNLYGSVTAIDVLNLIEEQGGVKLEKKSVLMKQPLKKTGTHTIDIRLKENVPAQVKIKLVGEGVVEKKVEKELPEQEEKLES